MATNTNPGYIDNKEELVNRLRRISGQVGGVECMVDEEPYCIDSPTPVAAIQAALANVSIALLDDHARHCVVGATKANRGEMTEEMMGVVGRLIRAY